MSRRVLNQLPKRLAASLLVSLLVIGSLLSIHPPVRAADIGAGQGIQISPVIIDLNGEKGGSYKLRVTVTNVTAGTLVLKNTINDFKAKGESGNPQVILGTEENSGTYSMKTWVSTIPDITLKSKESQSLTFNVDFPFAVC